MHLGVSGVFVFCCIALAYNERIIFVDRREFMGAVQDVIEDAYQFVLRNIHLGFVLYKLNNMKPPDSDVRWLFACKFSS